MYVPIRFLQLAIFTLTFSFGLSDFAFSQTRSKYEVMQDAYTRASSPAQYSDFDHVNAKPERAQTCVYIRQDDPDTVKKIFLKLIDVFEEDLGPLFPPPNDKKLSYTTYSPYIPSVLASNGKQVTNTFSKSDLILHLTNQKRDTLMTEILLRRDESMGGYTPFHLTFNPGKDEIIGYGYCFREKKKASK
jgi:hypothetical protein